MQFAPFGASIPLYWSIYRGHELNIIFFLFCAVVNEKLTIKQRIGQRASSTVGKTETMAGIAFAIAHIEDGHPAHLELWNESIGRMKRHYWFSGRTE